MTTEFELKLEVPAARAKSVRAALARLHPETEKLRAVYYDTPERLLRREGMALRLRSENGAWVQTLKAASASSLERLEHEVKLARSRVAPRPVAARHAGTPVGERLVRLLGLGFDDGAWEAIFETDVERSKATVDEGASRVEIAFDRGRIAAGRRTVALSEIEFESKKGEPCAAIELARRWCADHGLWLSTISKAHKGARLARADASFGPAASAAATQFNEDASLRRIAGEALAVSLMQVIRNVSELAAGSRDAESIHQARVGIRRTRTALRELAIRPMKQEEEALVHVFRRLGQHRDAQYVLAGVEAAPTASPARIVRTPAFQDAMLSLLAEAMRLRQDEDREPGVKREIRARLDKLWKKTMKDAIRFEAIDPPRQHRVRKRLKRLRYLAEFTATLHPRKKFDAQLRKLKKAQDALGEYVDDLTVLAYFRGPGKSRSDAWFVVPWLEAQRADAAGECGRRLREFAKLDPFWKGS